MHNDLELALKGSKLWVFVLTMMVCYNLHWGPWEGCRYQHEAAAAIKELVSVMKAGDVPSSW